jgi:hypothetical protein
MVRSRSTRQTREAGCPRSRNHGHAARRPVLFLVQPGFEHDAVDEQDVGRLRFDLAGGRILVLVVDPTLALGGGQFDDLAAVFLAVGIGHVRQVLADDRRVVGMGQHDAGLDVAHVDVQRALDEFRILGRDAFHDFVLALGLDHGGAALGHGDRIFLGRFGSQRARAGQQEGGRDYGGGQLHRMSFREKKDRSECCLFAFRTLRRGPSRVVVLTQVAPDVPPQRQR